MAKHLDLEEQEQLAEFKHFWRQYGNLITWVLIAIFGSFAAWNGYQYWQGKQGAQAAVMFEEVQRAVQSGDAARIDRSLADMKERFGKTVYAAQAGLLVAKTHYDKGNLPASKAALEAVAKSAPDDAFASIAKLRLAGLLLETKAYDEALAALGGNFSKDFGALASDRRGDVFVAQGKKPEAKAEYEKAFKSLDERAEYRRLVEVKLNALGVDPSAALAAPAAASSAAATPDAEVKKQ
jgi:predicted negative regulator of RcsB-dependent stress response